MQWFRLTSSRRTRPLHTPLLALALPLNVSSSPFAEHNTQPAQEELAKRTASTPPATREGDYTAMLKYGHYPFAGKLKYSTIIHENCAVKSAMAGGMGFGLGGFLAMLNWGFDSGRIGTPETAHMTDWQRLRYDFRRLRSNMWSLGKNFATIGVLISGTECVIDKHRGQHSVWHLMAASCVAGGVIAARAGPTAMCMSCGGFMAFTAVIEYLQQKGYGFGSAP